LPEAKLIGDLIRHADSRVASMVTQQTQSPQSFLPAPGASLVQLAQAACHCQACDLCQNATQTVFGEGPPHARILFVGEQPGDMEDQTGKPFVGPAGQLLNQALADAGILRSEIYVTNAVKHFRFEERGKRRVHKKPRGLHISACRPWLEAEIDNINPEIIVCLGATAAQSLLGRDVRILTERGLWLENRWAKRLIVTVHPSALLRVPDPARRQTEYLHFVDDLKLIKHHSPLT
jgi:uracil-DNA glycosylase family protein